MDDSSGVATGEMLFSSAKMMLPLESVTGNPLKAVPDDSPTSSVKSCGLSSVCASVKSRSETESVVWRSGDAINPAVFNDGTVSITRSPASVSVADATTLSSAVRISLWGEGPGTVGSVYRRSVPCSSG